MAICSMVSDPTNIDAVWKHRYHQTKSTDANATMKSSLTIFWNSIWRSGTDNHNTENRSPADPARAASL